MNKFFRPSFFKIAITIILLIIVFGGGLLYGFTLTITSNYSGSRQEFKETITLRSSAEARNN